MRLIIKIALRPLLFFALFLPAACRAQEQKAASGCELSVIKVIDGDTVVLSSGAKVRILNLNTPEKGENLSDEATRFTENLVGGKCVELNPAAPSKDKYGRLLADVVTGGKSLGESLVENGMAHVMLIPPYDAERAVKLLDLQASAKRSGKGIWTDERYKGGLHITSFRANPAGDESENPNLEYLRIANISGKKLNLKGYKITNRKGDSFIFPEVEVESGNTVILRSGKGANETGAGTQIEVYWMSDGTVWSNKGDTATIYDPDGNIIDMVEYGKKK